MCTNHNIQASDLLYTVPNVPHLRNVKLAIGYREVAESEAQHEAARLLSKWKQDPDADRYRGFSPRNKYYVNGVLTGEDLPKPYEMSKTPFPEKRVPRRGLVQVFPSDPEYAQICKEQGLEHLIKNGNGSLLSNGDSSSPVNEDPASRTEPYMNGTNGHAHVHDVATMTPAAPNGLPNGISSSSG
jgi:hypothetical protein